MELIYFIQSNTMLALVLFGLLGLCVGSFLNVVIHRIPLRMKFEARRDCYDFLAEQKDIDTESLTPIKAIVDKDTEITLSKPASRCPNCQHKIRWYENIPVLSWLILLRGKCSGCKTAISARYPFVEIVTALLSVLVIYTFGATLTGMSALVLVWLLVALTGIDIDERLLPDRITYPLIWLGLFVNTNGLFVSPIDAIFGALFGYLSLWIVVKIFYLITKKQGMGAGDFKLLAALGAWLGAGMLPLIIFLSALIGSVVGIVLRIKHGESRYYAFGPFLAGAGLVALFFGKPIMQWYL